MRALDGAAGRSCRTLHLVAIHCRIRIVVEQLPFSGNCGTSIGRGGVEQRKLLLQPAILIGGLDQVAEWKGR